jgi:hypothetical protein
MLAVLPQFVVRLWNAAALGADQDPADALDRTLPLFWGYHCGHDFGPALDVPRLRLPLDFPLSVDAQRMLHDVHLPHLGGDEMVGTDQPV